MSECGIDGPPGQETDSTRAHTRANDKWAQRATHRPKEKVGGPTRWPANHPGRPMAQWALPTQTFDVAAPDWMYRSVSRGSAADGASLGRGSLL